MRFNRPMYLMVLFVAAAYFIFADGWLAAYFLIVLLALPILSLLVTLLLLALGKVEMPEIPTRLDCLQGDEARIPISLTDSGRLALPCCLRIASEDRMSGKIRKRSLTAETGAACCLTVNTDHCGRWEIRVLRCRVCDLLGLFRLPVRKPEPCVVTVRPRPEKPDPIPDFSVFRQGRLRPKPGGGYSEIHEMREYRPGDPVSQIHWKLSAKRDSLIVREPQEPAELTAETVLETPEDRDRLDRILAQALWVGGEMAERGIAGSLGWLGMTACPVSDADSLARAMETLLSVRQAEFPYPGGHAQSVPGRILLTGQNGTAAAADDPSSEKSPKAGGKDRSRSRRAKEKAARRKGKG